MLATFDSVKLFTNSMFVLNFVWKARRKDKDTTAAQQEETKQYLHAAMLECTTSEKELREIVSLAEGIDYNEWIASHTIAFFDHINLLYGTISEFCSMSGCPEMSGPCNRLYHWVDEKGKRTKVAAPQYIDYVMIYTQKTVNDESIFPTKFDKEFPPTFESTVKRIMRLLYHVIAHIYHSHFKEIVLLNLHPHLNCIFAHLVLYNERFKLIEEKELEVLHDLAVALKLYPPNTTAGGNVVVAAVVAPAIAGGVAMSVDTADGGVGEAYGGAFTQDMAQAEGSPNSTGAATTTTATGHDSNNNTKVPTEAVTAAVVTVTDVLSVGDGQYDDGVITTQCRSISPFDAIYPAVNDVDLLEEEEEEEDASETKENEGGRRHLPHHYPNHHQFVNSPMLVDDQVGEDMVVGTPTMKMDEDLLHHHLYSLPVVVGSPEPMLVEPMTSSENIPKKQPQQQQQQQQQQPRSISANAVLLSTSTRSLDLAFASGAIGSTSPLTRRCNSDRTSGKTTLYADEAGGAAEKTVKLDTSCGGR